MNKETLKEWATKISKMTYSELIHFEQWTLELSSIDHRAKSFLIKACKLRYDCLTVVSPLVVVDNGNGELS